MGEYCLVQQVGLGLNCDLTVCVRQRDLGASLGSDELLSAGVPSVERVVSSKNYRVFDGGRQRLLE